MLRPGDETAVALLSWFSAALAPPEYLSHALADADEGRTMRAGMRLAAALLSLTACVDDARLALSIHGGRAASDTDLLAAGGSDTCLDAGAASLRRHRADRIRVYAAQH